MELTNLIFVKGAECIIYWGKWKSYYVINYCCDLQRNLFVSIEPS